MSRPSRSLARAKVSSPEQRPRSQPRRSDPKAFAEFMASLSGYEAPEWIRTGMPAIDMIIGAGIPRGRFIEVIGDPATAKTGFALQTVAAFQRAGGIAVYFDAEAKLDRDWGERLGVDFKAMGYERPKDLKEFVRLLGQVAKTADPKTPVLVVVDSIAAIPGAEELDAATSEKGLGAEKAARARMLSAALRATLMALSNRGVTLLGLNQLRTVMNFYSAYSGVESPGGKAVKYHAAVRLMFRPKGRIKDMKRGIVTGIAVEIEAIKNTCSAPFRKALMKFKFDTGFVTYSGLDELLLRHGRIHSVGGWLRYGERKFHASDIGDVLSEFPNLISPLVGVTEEQEPVSDLEAPVEPFVDAPCEAKEESR